MNKAYSFLIIVLLHSLSAYAQEIIEFQENLNRFDEFGYHIEDVIVAQEEKDCIGFVYKGFSDKQVAAYFEEDIRTSVFDFLKQNFPQKENTKPLIIKINNLFISELRIPAKGSFAAADLNISFIGRRDSLYLDLFQAVASIKESSLNITGLHDENLLLAFNTCFEDFNKRDDLNHLTYDAISWEDLHFPVKDYSTHEILNQPDLIKGVYLNFNDFRDNIINTNYPFELKYKVKEHTILTAKVKFEDEEPEKYWGISDGTNLFIHIDDKLYLLNQENDSLKTSLKLENQSLNYTAVYTGVMFGAIGGMLGAIVHEVAEKNYYVEHWLDFNSGTLFPLEMKDPFKLQTIKTFYYSDYSKIDEDVCIYLNNNKFNCLRESQYYNMPVSPFRGKAVLTIASREHSVEVEDFDPNVLDHQYYILKVKRKGDIFLKECKRNMINVIIETLEDKECIN
ncbi:MAG: hypothetical protein K9G47_02425 [Bacteroidales bacterium]|nr:hypothetical protein [Bacteroidales bacterium]